MTDRRRTVQSAQPEKNRRSVVQPVKKLSIGTGFHRRLTKAGVLAEARFRTLVEDAIVALGAARAPVDGLWDERKRDWSIETKHGKLWLTIHGTWIAGLWDNWPRAQNAGLDHWKWNHHYDEGAAEPAVEHFVRQLKAVLP